MGTAERATGSGRTGRRRERWLINYLKLKTSRGHGQPATVTLPLAEVPHVDLGNCRAVSGSMVTVAVMAFSSVVSRLPPLPRQERRRCHCSHRQPPTTIHLGPTLRRVRGTRPSTGSSRVFRPAMAGSGTRNASDDEQRIARRDRAAKAACSATAPITLEGGDAAFLNVRTVRSQN